MAGNKQCQLCGEFSSVEDLGKGGWRCTNCKATNRPPYVEDDLKALIEISPRVADTLFDGQSVEVEGSDKPKIYCFSNVAGGGWGIAMAMAEDGTVLAQHLCSNEGYIPIDLGVGEDSRFDRNEEYSKHYPDGYEIEYVAAVDVSSHEGVTEAYRLNQIAGKLARKEKS